LSDRSLDPAFRALVMAPFGHEDVAQALATRGHAPDPQAIHDAFETLAETRAEAFAPLAAELYAENTIPGPFSPDAKAAGMRSLQLRALGMITRRDDGKAARAFFAAADNMTQQIGALSLLLNAQTGARENKAFFAQWRNDRLVVDKWFGLQVGAAEPEDAAAVAASLTEHPEFTMKNPNRFRAVFGALAGHHAGFHHASGAGYKVLAKWLIRLDPINPQTTARMCSAFSTWKRYDAPRQALIQKELERILATKGLSGDTTEMVSRILGA
jgi:aminopeptidase N